ncbi:MAG: hypothetical protein ABSB81_11550 [Halobacteriota archaeon]
MPAAEKLLRKCSTRWGAYQYLQDRVHDGWLPDSARQQLRRIIKRIQVHKHQCREYGYAYEGRAKRKGVAVAHERSVFLLPSPDERT